MSSAALSPPSPQRLVGRVARLSPLFMLCVAAMGGAYVAGRDARLATERAVAALAPVGHGAPLPGAGPVAPIVPLRGALSDARDIECLTQAVYYEARGEPESGQAAVAQVVLNRTRTGRYPASVCGVVFQHAHALGRAGCQFSFACDRQTLRPRERAAWGRAERVARAALAGGRATAIGGATQFRVAGLSSNGLERIARIGAHVFYRLGHPAPRPAPATLAAPPRPAAAGEATVPPPPAPAVSAPAETTTAAPAG